VFRLICLNNVIKRYIYTKLFEPFPQVRRKASKSQKWFEKCFYPHASPQKGFEKCFYPHAGCRKGSKSVSAPMQVAGRVRKVFLPPCRLQEGFEKCFYPHANLQEGFEKFSKTIFAGILPKNRFFHQKTQEKQQ
jgi:hypothetical protein